LEAMEEGRRGEVVTCCGGGGVLYLDAVGWKSCRSNLTHFFWCSESLQKPKFHLQRNRSLTCPFSRYRRSTNGFSSQSSLIAKLVSMEPVPGCPRYIVTFARNLTLSSKWVGLEVLAICAWETTLQVEFRIRGRVTFTTYHLDHSVHHIPDSVYSRTIFHQLLPLRSSNPILKKKWGTPKWDPILNWCLVQALWRPVSPCALWRWSIHFYNSPPLGFRTLDRGAGGRRSFQECLWFRELERAQRYPRISQPTKHVWWMFPGPSLKSSP
jgi:hypothetical protein